MSRVHIEMDGKYDLMRGAGEPPARKYMYDMV
jgi:hypothetical protein